MNENEIGNEELKEADMTEDINPIPKQNGKDIAHTLTRAGISIIPLVGGSVNELLSLVVTPSLEKRRDEWLESVAKKLEDLEAKIENFKIEDLQENESFISTVMQASRIAISNHHKAKMEALQNAVLNAALPSAISDDLQLMFLNWIDYFTPRHLQILKFFNDFRPAHQPTGEGKTELFFLSNKNSEKLNVKQAFPNLSVNEDIYNQIFADLRTRGLIEPKTSDTDLFLNKIKHGELITKLGKQFLDSITSPIETKDEQK